MFEPREPPDDFTLPLSAAHLRWQMEMVGWSDGELAGRLNVDESKVYAWRRAKSNIPNHVAVWLETLAYIVTSIPMPIGWQPDKSVGRAHHAGAQLARDGFSPERFFDDAEA